MQKKPRYLHKYPNNFNECLTTESIMEPTYVIEFVLLSDTSWRRKLYYLWNTKRSSFLLLLFTLLLISSKLQQAGVTINLSAFFIDPCYAPTQQI